MRKSKHDQDDWIPTSKELAQFRSIAEMDPELLAAYQKGISKTRGRPLLQNKKQTISLRLDSEVLTALKAKGKGWQTYLNAFLLSAVKEHRM